MLVTRTAQVQSKVKMASSNLQVSALQTVLLAGAGVNRVQSFFQDFQEKVQSFAQKQNNNSPSASPSPSSITASGPSASTPICNFIASDGVQYYDTEKNITERAGNILAMLFSYVNFGCCIGSGIVMLIIAVIVGASAGFGNIGTILLLIIALGSIIYSIVNYFQGKDNLKKAKATTNMNANCIFNPKLVLSPSSSPSPSPVKK